jgi:hypothetical protein
MNTVSAPLEKLNELISNGSFIGKTIDFEILNILGIFVLKKPLSKSVLDFYISAYFKDKSVLERQPYHLTMVNAAHEHDLNKILHEPEITKIVSGFFNGNVGSDYVNIFRKDEHDTKPVFLHQDSSYLLGNFNKYSLFISLTECYRENGGLIVYPGTQNFGHLGDAGEINADVLPNGYPKIEINTNPGDILIMHSAIWHESPANIDLTERVYLEIKIRDANDSSTINVICGQRTSEWANTLTINELFKNSRTQRLKDLYQQIEK